MQIDAYIFDNHASLGFMINKNKTYFWGTLGLEIQDSIYQFGMEQVVRKIVRYSSGIGVLMASGQAMQIEILNGQIKSSGLLAFSQIIDIFGGEIISCLCQSGSIISSPWNNHKTCERAIALVGPHAYLGISESVHDILGNTLIGGAKHLQSNLVLVQNTLYEIKPAQAKLIREDVYAASEHLMALTDGTLVDYSGAVMHLPEKIIYCNSNSDGARFAYGESGKIWAWGHNPYNCLNLGEILIADKPIPMSV
ncbi:hypothetical protein D3C78_19330 [compost metagenome]